MRILLLSHSFNNLTQRLHVELCERSHEVSVELDITGESVALYRPDLVIAPFLKRAIPDDVWRAVRCLIVHPGPPGDRGPAALDGPFSRASRSGVSRCCRRMANSTPVQSGSIARSRCGVPRNPASTATRSPPKRWRRCSRPLPRSRPGTRRPRQWRAIRAFACGALRQADRAINWQHDTTVEVLRKIDSADGMPGLTDSLFWQDVRLFDAHEAHGISGEPGTVVAQCDGALARATVEGAVWIGHVRSALAARLRNTPPAPALPRTTETTSRSVVSMMARARSSMAFDVAPGLIRRAVGGLDLGKMNAVRPIITAAGQQQHLGCARKRGSISVEQCLAAVGAHGGVVEVELQPANLAMLAIFDRTVAASWPVRQMRGFRREDLRRRKFQALRREVWASDRTVLNPHYKNMGNVYGSEYWTYLLPQRAGAANAAMITQCRLPMGVAEAGRLGIVDRVLTARGAATDDLVRLAAALASDPGYAARLVDKRRRRAADQAEKPLDAYRNEELRRMRLNFYGFDPSYHVARYNFIHGPEVAYAADHR